jgi:uncharacterized protein
MRRDDRNLKEKVEKGIFKEGQTVDVEIYEFTELGAKVAINGIYAGLVYGSEIFRDVHIGEKCKAYIKLIRPDGKIDVTLRPREGIEVMSSAEKIFYALCNAGGKLNFNDKSSPDDIQMYFQISKKVFKKAIGTLYKQRKIKITDTGIEKV